MSLPSSSTHLPTLNIGTSHEHRIYTDHESTYVRVFLIDRRTYPKDRNLYMSHELRIYMGHTSTFEAGVLAC